MGNKSIISLENILSLNKPCQVKIFSFLDPVDTSSCLRVSKLWRKCVKNPKIWINYDSIYLNPSSGILCGLIGKSDIKYRPTLNPQQFGKIWFELIRKSKLDVRDAMVSLENTIDNLNNCNDQAFRITVIKTLIDRSNYVLTLINQHKFIEAMNQLEESNDLFDTIKP